jgi:hypothetical protein
VSLVLFVLFTVADFMWLLSLLGLFGPESTGGRPPVSAWLAWFAVTVLGPAVFVTGPVVWRVP